jgi:hypothetical protein
MVSPKCVVGVRTPSGNTVKAFDVCIDGHDVYVNYSDCSTPEAHASYHESGQYHMKKSKGYIQWDGGLAGEMQPMKLFRTSPQRVKERSNFWTVGWYVAKLDHVLPTLDGTADMLVDAGKLQGNSILGFEASVVGGEARKRDNIVGYAIIDSHQFGGALRVEIDAFVISE